MVAATEMLAEVEVEVSDSLGTASLVVAMVAVHGLSVRVVGRLAVGLAVRLVEGTLVGVEALHVTLGVASGGTLVLAAHVARAVTAAVVLATVVVAIALGSAMAGVPLGALTAALVRHTVVGLMSAGGLVQIVSLVDVRLIRAVHVDMLIAIHVGVLEASVLSITALVGGLVHDWLLNLALVRELGRMLGPP